MNRLFFAGRIWERIPWSIFSSTLAILSGHEGRMCLTIDELSHSSCYRQRTSYATPARSDHTGLGALCTTVFASGLAPCSALAPGSDPYASCTRGHGRLAGDRVGNGAPLHPLPPGLESGHLVRPPGESDAVEPACHAIGPTGGHDRAVGGRYRGTPQWTEDHRQRLLSRCRALLRITCDPLIR